MVFVFPIKRDIKPNTSLPLMSKEDILRRKKPFLAVKGYTSGTTNKPLTVYRSIKSILLEEYVIKSYWKKISIPLRPRIVVLRGDHVCDASNNQGPFWKKMPFSGRLMMSSFHISEVTFNSYLAAIEEYKPHVIMAYPSSILMLAKYAKKINWQPDWNLKAVFTSSELFKKDDLEIVSSVFGKVCDHYGQGERVAALQQCLTGNYHVRQDYSFVEFIEDKNGTKIVGSNFHNKAMPLIRYDTGDYVEGYHYETCCDCGDTSPYVRKIIGRDEDFILLPDGRQIRLLNVAFKGVIGLVECQLEQPSLNQLIVRYVPEYHFDIKPLEKTIESNLRKLLGDTLDFSFEKIDKIPRTKAGKFRSVIRDRTLDNV